MRIRLLGGTFGVLAEHLPPPRRGQLDPGHYLAFAVPWSCFALVPETARLPRHAIGQDGGGDRDRSWEQLALSINWR